MFGISWARSPFSIFLVAALLVVASTVGANAAEPLSHEQLATLQSEAEAAFDRGVKLQPADPVNAKDEFALAAQKYQLQADAQPNSGPLCFNLANAYLQSGQVGTAIANYLRAEKLMPGDERVAAGLQAARILAGTQTTAQPKSLADNFGRWNQAIPLGTRMWIGIAAWMVLWSALAATMFWPSRRWRLASMPALVVAVVAAASVGYQRFSSPESEHGVVTVAQAVVREGNGEGFGPAFSQPLPAGTEFAVVDHRGEWIKIGLSDGRSGWLNEHDAAVVE
jgi:hypothetical protein